MAAVQALPPAPAAQTSPAAAVPAPSANPMATPWGAGALHQRLNSFVKKTLLQQLVPAGAVVSGIILFLTFSSILSCIGKTSPPGKLFW